MSTRIAACGAACLYLISGPATAALAAEGPKLPAGTRVYLEIDEKVTSAHGGGDVGAVVRCRVWRDVDYQGVTFIKGGAPAICRIEKVSHATIGGFKGKLAVGGVEARSVDDQSVMLTGGYNKEGTGHAGVVWTVGLLVFWPALFFSGGNAVLPPGTVFDVETVNDTRLVSSPVEAPTTIDLTGMGGALTADFMLDDFVAQPKHEIMRIKLSKSGDMPAEIVVDSVNGSPVEPIPVKLTGAATTDGASTAVAEVETKALAKHFVRGINRFELSYKDGADRKAAEVVMNVQM